MKHYKIIFIKYSDIKKSLFRLFFHKVIFLIKKERTSKVFLFSFDCRFRYKTILSLASYQHSIESLFIIKGRKERDSAPLAYAHVRLICSIHSQFLRYTRLRPKPRFESLFR